MFKYTIIIGIFLIFIISCSQVGKDSTQQNKNNISDENPASRLFKNRNSEWDGTYKGFLPCTNCNGIETFITLNKDNTYNAKIKFVGSDTESQEQSGKIIWNESTEDFILENLNIINNRFVFDDNNIVQLAKDGTRIIGSDQEEYVLNKINTSTVNDMYSQLLDKKWRLIEINGSKVIPPAGDKLLPVEITFDSKNSLISGHAGCNNFFGNFGISTGTKLFFGKISMTKVYCPQIEIENLLMQNLEKTDNFDIIDGILLFKKGKGVPHTKFKLID